MAAVEILRAISEQKISGTATGHNGAAPQTGICSKKKAQDNYISTIRRVTEAGTFASAAGGGKSEQKGVAAVEILRAISEQKISGTATGHNGAAPQTGICSKKKAQDNYISTIRRVTEAVITGRS